MIASSASMISDTRALPFDIRICFCGLQNNSAIQVFVEAAKTNAAESSEALRQIAEEAKTSVVAGSDSRASVNTATSLVDVEVARVALCITQALG